MTARNIVTWGLSGLVGLAFIAAGGSKLIDPATHGENFVAFGLPASLAVFIGLCEVAGGIGLLIPRLAAWAAAGLTIIMAGAVYNHVDSGIPSPAPAAVLGVLCIVLFALRRSRAVLIGAPAAAEPLGAASGARSEDRAA